jgi:cytochrome c6
MTVMSLIRRCVLAVVLALTIVFSVNSAVLAADLDNGAKVFTANCASCHVGGGNIINRAKTLSEADLTKYGMNSLDKVIAQVTNGKPPMPSFKTRLTADQIEDVAAYVLDQSAQGW